MRFLLVVLKICLITVFFAPRFAQAINTHFAEHRDVQSFINELAIKYNFDPKELTSLFNEVSVSPVIIAKITKPAEYRPWDFYQDLFITPQRIADGKTFEKMYGKSLDRAEKEFGVDKNIIVSVMGVETFYGRLQGKFRVIDALSTLAFAYPPRAPFFKEELKHYLLLSREKNFDPRLVYGSYAGAMGQPQFMPSSYRQYAVDYDKDGRADLIASYHDVIGSIGNYLKQKGWEKDGLIAVPAKVSGEQFVALLNQKVPSLTLNELVNYGITPEMPVAGNPKAILIELKSPLHTEYWLGFHNFYVITRYNTSPLYAMAVYQLSQKISNRS